ncbi:hypothetical protein Xvtr_13355 [Xanthomonas campestris pv. vitiscarnosae]|uniref:Transposase n=1 Tax=Xanthomonas cissicola TaxID=86186 RepID=A0ABX3M3J1_9XANT|nr:hypothetical protein Xant_17400 [Xanthomonas cissicola]OOW93839.1 hypothetical protein Xvtr_13355 [Xanthomonas campestris pv. vitiscarnosae]
MAIKNATGHDGQVGEAYVGSRAGRLDGQVVRLFRLLAVWPVADNACYPLFCQSREIGWTKLVGYERVGRKLSEFHGAFFPEMGRWMIQ